MSSPGGPVAIVLRDVWKRYRLWHERRQSLKEVVVRRGRGRYEDFWALRGVSFEVARGDTFGIVGANGSGKSTLLKLLAGILEPNKGEIIRRGRLSALLELGAGFHPELTGRENIYLNGSIVGLSRKQISERFDDIVEFAELGTFIDSPIRSYSSGMYIRLGFAVAVHSDPEILLVDEVLAVGDESYQRKSAERILQIRDRGTTIVVVSHNLDLVRGICRNAIWMDGGEIRAHGRPEMVVDEYLQSVTGSAPQIGYVPAPGSRFGSGELKVVEMQCFGLREGDPLRTGRPATIRLKFKAERRINRPVFGVALFRASDGLHVAGPNTRDVGMEIPFVEGDGAIEFTMESFPLLPDSYLLSVAATDYTLTHTYDHQDRLHRVEVESGNPAETFGVISLGGKWRLQIPEAEEKLTDDRR